MFSLPTLPLQCCSSVFTDVTALTSSTLVTLLAKRAYIKEDYCWYVRKLAMLRDRDTEALKSPIHTEVLQQNVLAK